MQRTLPLSGNRPFFIHLTKKIVFSVGTKTKSFLPYATPLSQKAERRPRFLPARSMKILSGNVRADIFQRGFFQPRYLRLRNSHFRRYFRLRFTFEISQKQNFLFPLAQFSHRFAKRHVFRPGFVGILRIGKLVHQKQRVARLVIHGFVQRNGVGNRVQRVHYFALRHAHFRGNFFKRRHLVAAFDFLARFQHKVCRIAYAARYSQRISVADKPLDFPDNHRKDNSMGKTPTGF